MASTSEVGHNKNVANFNTLAQILEEMGILYNPSNTNIALINLVPIQATLSTVIGNLNQKKPLYTNAVADREIAMTEMKKKSSRILNSFKSINVSEKDKKNAAMLVKKIRGDRKSKKINLDNADATTISTAQLSYDSRIANIDALISFISSHPEYNPNEADIQVLTLQTTNQELRTLTYTVNATISSLITARKDRNDILYYNSGNVLDLVKEIKAYLKSLGEAGKPYYKAVVRLKFKEVI